MSFYYFAFGSNLLKERLQLANPSAQFVCTAKLEVGLIIVTFYLGHLCLEHTACDRLKEGIAIGVSYFV